jgi:hypothetical protein
MEKLLTTFGLKRVERSWSLGPKQDPGDASWKPCAPQKMKGSKSSIFWN